MLVHCRALIQWNNGLGRWWCVAQCTVWAFRVVVLSPILDDDPGLLERVKHFAVQEFVAHSTVEALAEAVFPRAAWRDVSGLSADGLDPVADGLSNEFRAVTPSEYIGWRGYDRLRSPQIA